MWSKIAHLVLLLSIKTQGKFWNFSWNTKTQGESQKSRIFSKNSRLIQKNSRQNSKNSRICQLELRWVGKFGQKKPEFSQLLLVKVSLMPLSLLRIDQIEPNLKFSLDLILCPYHLEQTDLLFPTWKPYEGVPVYYHASRSEAQFICSRGGGDVWK